MRARGMLLLLVSVATVGCGGDGGSGPTPTADVEGTWAFEAHNLTAPGAGGSCSLTGTLMLAQNGETVGGEYAIDRITCSGPGGGTVEGPITGPIVDGSVAGNQVHFHFDTEDVDQHGTVSGGHMSGSCTWTSDEITLTGVWSATRL